MTEGKRSNQLVGVKTAAATMIEPAPQPVLLHASIGKARIACVYENQPLSADSTYAVPRVAAQLLTWLAAANPAAEIMAAGPAGSQLLGVQTSEVEPHSFAQLCRRTASAGLAKMFGRPVPAEATLPYQRAKMGLKQLAGRHQRPTILLCVTLDTATLARKCFPDACVVYWIHSLPRLGQESLAARAVDAADCIVVPTAAIYADLFELICRNRFTPPVWVIPNCVDTVQFAPISAEQRAATRARLGLQSGDLAIMHVGRGPEKGLQVVEMALSLLPTNRQGSVLLVSAGGTQTERRALGQGREILQVGRVAPGELNEFYQACDLGVVPSVWWENCPLALLEMMSSGLCVAGSRVGGIPEIIEHGDNGLLVDRPNDVHAWAQTIEAALVDQDLRLQLGLRARHTIATRFSREQFLEQWTRLLQTLAGPASSRAERLGAGRGQPLQ